MAKKKRKRWQRRLIKFLVLVIVLGLLAGSFVLFVLPGLAAGATTTYNSYTASIGTISNSMSFSGSISVKNNETLVSESNATVRQIYVEEEQNVVSGDKLVRLSNGETVKANFDGRVNEIFVAADDSVAMNTSLIQIVDFNNMKVTFRVDEYSISNVYVGQDCTVSVTALDVSFDSKVTHINRISASTGSTAYYTVTAELTVTDDVLPGMQVTVTIKQEEAVDAVILNKNALSFTMNNSAYVLMYDDADELQTVEVEIGVDNDNYVEVTSGLSEGDVVYAQVVESLSGSGGIFSMFGGDRSGMGGGMNMQGGQTMQFDRSNFDSGNAPSMRDSSSGGTGMNFSGAMSGG